MKIAKNLMKTKKNLMKIKIKCMRIIRQIGIHWETMVQVHYTKTIIVNYHVIIKLLFSSKYSNLYPKLS